jgi:hypothetical protein
LPGSNPSSSNRNDGSYVPAALVKNVKRVDLTLFPSAETEHGVSNGANGHCMTLPYLPKIWIATDVEASFFLNRPGELAPSVYGGRSDYEARTHVPDGVTVLTLSPRARSVTAGRFLFELSPDRDVKRRLCVEASISREIRPDYEEYTGITRSTLMPLLKAYNKRYGGNRKLHMQTKAQVTPGLAQGQAKLFHRFAAGANKTSLSHYDWEHFYSFISLSYQRNGYIAGEDLVLHYSSIDG